MVSSKKSRILYVGDSEGYFQFGLKILNQTIALNFSTWIRKLRYSIFLGVGPNRNYFLRLSISCNNFAGTHRSSPSVSTFFPLSEFSYFVIRFLYHIVFVINFSYFVIKFYYRAIK